MKTIVKILVLSTCLACAALFASCSKLGGVGGSDYIQVTVDGKTFKENIKFVMPYGRGDNNYYQYNGDRVTFELTYLWNFNDLLDLPTGFYRLYGEYLGTWEEGYDSTLGDEPFDLYLGVHEKYDENWRCVKNNSGVNNVTLIKKSGEKVVVKGEFSGKLTDGSDISGNYKLTLVSR